MPWGGAAISASSSLPGMPRSAFSIRGTFWACRSTLLEAVNDGSAQFWQPDQFSASGAHGRSVTLSRHTAIVVQIRQLFIVVGIAFDLAIVRRAVPTDFCGDLAHRHFRDQHIFDQVPFAQIQLSSGHRPFFLLSSKIGELSRPILEWAPLQAMMTRNPDYVIR